jgi:uncharacterized membrane-anchored protein YjiN (DUF445 family)
MVSLTSIDGDGVERRQAERLRRSRALATGLLALAGASFAATLMVRNPGPALLLLRAVAEAALVGGLADWFAVTALFRRPLGLPIPHTAILPANKERIGEGLARFLDCHFLAPELLLPELRSLQIANKIAAWLARRRTAQTLAGEIAKAVPHLLRAVDDRQITAFLAHALGRQLRSMELGPVAGQLIRILTASGYHEAVLDSALDYAGDFLARNQGRMLDTVAERRRGWIPRVINRQIARAVLRGAGELIDDLRKPGGSARQALLARIDEIADELVASRGSPTRSGSSLRAIVNRPEVSAWLASSWHQLRDLLLHDLESPSPQLRRTIALMIVSFGETLRTDAAMCERLNATIEAVVAEALPWRSELIRFVTAVVRRWEPRSFSDRIEAAVGADLQYIRMNGTVVGGLVGGALHLLAMSTQ